MRNHKVFYDHLQGTTCTLSTTTITAWPFFFFFSPVAKRKKKTLHTLIHEHVPTSLNSRTHKRVCRIKCILKCIPRRRLTRVCPTEGPKSSMSLMRTSLKVAQSKMRAQNCPAHPKAQVQLKTQTSIL